MVPLLQLLFVCACVVVLCVVFILFIFFFFHFSFFWWFGKGLLRNCDMGIFTYILARANVADNKLVVFLFVFYFLLPHKSQKIYFEFDISSKMSQASGLRRQSTVNVILHSRRKENIVSFALIINDEATLNQKTIGHSKHISIIRVR